MSRNTKPIGVAYEDQYLNGAELDNCTVEGGSQDLDDLSADDATIGDASGVVAFFGGTRTTQPTVVAVVTTTGATSTTNAYGFTTAAQADALVTAVNSVITRLEALNLFADS